MVEPVSVALLIFSVLYLAHDEVSVE